MCLTYTYTYICIDMLRPRRAGPLAVDALGFRRALGIPTRRTLATRGGCTNTHTNNNNINNNDLWFTINTLILTTT